MDILKAWWYDEVKDLNFSCPASKAQTISTKLTSMQCKQHTSIPNGQVDLFTANLHHFDFKVHTCAFLNTTCWTWNASKHIPMVTGWSSLYKSSVKRKRMLDLPTSLSPIIKTFSNTSYSCASAMRRRGINQGNNIITITITTMLRPSSCQSSNARRAPRRRRRRRNWCSLVRLAAGSFSGVAHSPAPLRCAPRLRSFRVVRRYGLRMEAFPPVRSHKVSNSSKSHGVRLNSNHYVLINITFYCVKAKKRQPQRDKSHSLCERDSSVHGSPVRETNIWNQRSFCSMGLR